MEATEAETTDAVSFLRKLEALYPTLPHRPGFNGSHSITLNDHGQPRVGVWFQKPGNTVLSYVQFGMVEGEEFGDKLMRFINLTINAKTRKP